MSPELLIQILMSVIGLTATGYAKAIHDNFKETNNRLTDHLVDRSLHTKCGNPRG